MVLNLRCSYGTQQTKLAWCNGRNRDLMRTKGNTQTPLIPPVRYVTDRRGGLMVSALDSGSSGPGSSAGRGHCAVFLDKTLYSQYLRPPRPRLCSFSPLKTYFARLKNLLRAPRPPATQAILTVSLSTQEYKISSGEFQGNLANMLGV